MSTWNVLTVVFVALCVVLREGFGLPLSSSQPDLSPAPPPSSPESESSSSPQRHRLVRTKRCSCNSWLDKECIYFCHLDIIWVNTPGKILPYGLGSPLSRRRRRRSVDVDRCRCADPADPTCSSFCYDDSSQSPSVVAVEPAADTEHNLLLQASLRSAVKSNMATAARHTASSRKRPSSRAATAAAREYRK